jgi:Flp pilus assembly protein TadG
MVEFVVGSPILLLLLYCVTEIGRAFVQYNTLVDAARDADRYLATNALLGTTGLCSIAPGTSGAAQNLVVYGNTAGAGSPILPNLSTSQVTIACDALTDASVSVAYPYQSLFGGSIPNFFKSGSINTAMTLNVYTSMRGL